MKSESTHGLVGGLLVLVALLVGSSLGLIGGLLLLRELLPLVAEELSDVTWEESATIFKYMSSRLTELDAGVVLADLVTLLVGEEHVGRETALGGVGVWIASALATMEV